MEHKQQQTFPKMLCDAINIWIRLMNLALRITALASKCKHQLRVTEGGRDWAAARKQYWGSLLGARAAIATHDVITQGWASTVGMWHHQGSNWEAWETIWEVFFSFFPQHVVALGNVGELQGETSLEHSDAMKTQSWGCQVFGLQSKSKWKLVVQYNWNY